MKKDLGNKISYGLQPIEHKISDLLKPIFSGNKKEFVIINNLVKNWEEIVGKKYAKFCYPKLVNFDKNQKGAKLTVAVFNSAAAFFLENNSEFLLERIAVFYGHKTIVKIAIKLEPQVIDIKTEKEIRLPQKHQERLENVLSSIEDKELAQTLEKLGKEILIST